MLQLGFDDVPNLKPDFSATDESEARVYLAEEQDILRNLHTLLVATEVREGKMVCGKCGHEYKIKEGIANFLLPSHLGEFVTKSICFASASADECHLSLR